MTIFTEAGITRRTYFDAWNLYLLQSAFFVFT